MKIAVLLKQVPDTETKIKVNGNASGIEEAGIKYIVSPYDEFAIEEALKTATKVAGSEVYAISLGPVRCVESIRTALAMGASKGIHIDSTGAQTDSYVTAKALAAVALREKFDLIFCGKQAIDEDAGQVAQMVAALIDAPQVMIVEKFEVSGDGAILERGVSGGTREVYEVKFPVVVGCEKGLNTPRYASLPGIMKAKTKPLETLKLADLVAGVSVLTTNVNFRLPPERAAGKILEGEVAQVVPQLVKLLREEAKVI